MNGIIYVGYDVDMVYVNGIIFWVNIFRLMFDWMMYKGFVICDVSI